MPLADKRFKYLKLATVRVTKRRLSIGMLFQILLTFSFGIVIGFNIRDLLIRSDHSKKQIYMHSIVQQAENSKVGVPHKKRLTVMFESLPQSLEINTTRKKAANAYTLLPWKLINFISNENNRYFMTFVVKSARGLAGRRFLVRKTWGSIDNINGDKFGLFFIIGATLSQEEQLLLEKENKIYGDILQSDVNDDYVHLPSKIMSALQFISERSGDISDYYVTTDDDCSINVAATYDYFIEEQNRKRQFIHCGYIYDVNHTPVRNEGIPSRTKEKWGISREIYPGPKYPPFCHGGMIILAYESLSNLYHTSEITNYTHFHLEDVFMSGILRHKYYNNSNNLAQIYQDGMKGRYMPRQKLVNHLGTIRRLEFVFNSRWSRFRSQMVLDSETDMTRKFPLAAMFNATSRLLPTIEGKQLNETMKFFVESWRAIKRKSMLAESSKEEEEAEQEERPIGDEASVVKGESDDVMKNRDVKVTEGKAAGEENAPELGRNGDTMNRIKVSVVH